MMPIMCGVIQKIVKYCSFALFISMNSIRNSGFRHSDLAAQIMHQYSLKSISGQQEDILNSCRDEKSYLQMIEQKSGSLVAMSCLIGSCLATGKISPEIETYSTYIGIIQQIKNDISDFKRMVKEKRSSAKEILFAYYLFPFFGLRNILIISKIITILIRNLRQVIFL